MPVWALHVTANVSAPASASATTMELVLSSPAPPKAVGTSMPTNPSRPNVARSSRWTA